MEEFFHFLGISGQKESSKGLDLCCEINVSLKWAVFVAKRIGSMGKSRCSDVNRLIVPYIWSMLLLGCCLLNNSFWETYTLCELSLEISHSRRLLEYILIILAKLWSIMLSVSSWMCAGHLAKHMEVALWSIWEKRSTVKCISLYPSQ